MGEGSENKSLDSVCEVSTVFSESENVHIQWGRSRRGKMGSKRWGEFEESSSQDKAMHVISHSGNAQGESWPHHSCGHKHRHTRTYTHAHEHNAHVHMHRHTHVHTHICTHAHFCILSAQRYIHKCHASSFSLHQSWILDQLPQMKNFRVSLIAETTKIFQCPETWMPSIPVGRVSSLILVVRWGNTQRKWFHSNSTRNEKLISEA